MAELVQQIELARDLEADGFILWHSHPRLFEEQFVEYLRVGALRAPARLPWHPNAPTRVRPEPPPKAPKFSHHLPLPIDEC